MWYFDVHTIARLACETGHFQSQRWSTWKQLTFSSRKLGIASKSNHQVVQCENRVSSSAEWYSCVKLWKLGFPEVDLCQVWIYMASVYLPWWDRTKIQKVICWCYIVNPAQNDLQNYSGWAKAWRWTTFWHVIFIFSGGAGVCVCVCCTAQQSTLSKIFKHILHKPERSLLISFLIIALLTNTIFTTGVYPQQVRLCPRIRSIVADYLAMFALVNVPRGQSSWRDPLSPADVQ